MKCSNNIYNNIFRCLQNIDSDYRRDTHISKRYRTCNLWIWKESNTNIDNHIDIYFKQYDNYNEIVIELKFTKDGNSLRRKIEIDFGNYLMANLNLMNYNNYNLENGEIYENNSYAYDFESIAQEIDDNYNMYFN